jgi:glycosyltransferase involved in cell wall biosynthesis
VTRVVVISPEPTPYRAPLFDRIAARDDVELTVLYAARTVSARDWQVRLHHRAIFLRGYRLPGVSSALRHDYPVTPGVWRALARARPDVVVVSGWSTFPSQAAVVWCRLHRLPYVLLVESHDRGHRAGWRRAIKRAVVPRIVRRACGVLTVGSLSRGSMLERGACPDRMGTFANTVDVADFGERADRLAGSRAELRARFGLEPGDVAILCVARLAPEKGLDTLVRAAAAAGHPVSLLLVGAGGERKELEQLARSLGVRTIFAGDLPWEQIVEAYAASDVFALLSLRETWGVVVNEAAACGLPLVLSDHVGAASDLLRSSENGYLVPVGDVVAAAEALKAIAADPSLRRRFGARSREIVASWGYEPSVSSFVEIVKAAAADRR